MPEKRSKYTMKMRYEIPIVCLWGLLSVCRQVSAWIAPVPEP